MTTQRPASRSTAQRLRPLLWVAGSFVLFYLLFFDPLGLHPVDGWLERAVGYHAMPRSEMAPSAAPATASADREVLFYRNPMDPTITSPVPAKDEMGMNYLPVYADEAERVVGEGTTVSIDAAVIQNMNVRTAPVERRDLTHEIRTVGYLEYDQQRMVTVTTKYSGWVEKVYVNYIGEPVAKGEPLFEVYSPELVQTEQELLSAIEYVSNVADAPEDARRRAQALVDSARTRLSLWDISEAQIARLEETGEIFRTLTVTAPAGGLVMRRMAGLEGMAVRPGLEAYHIADISTLWLSVEVFEDQVAWIRSGMEAAVTFAYFPGETVRGTVRFLEPEFSEETRTLAVKIAVPNTSGRLRKGMFATVVFEPVAAPGALVVPSEAVLQTGRRSVVIVAGEGGRFEPHEVVLGHASEGYYQVLSGLAGGERVVTSAQFLLDSESRLKEAIQKMMSSTAASEAGGAPIEREPGGADDHAGHGGAAMAHGE